MNGVQDLAMNTTRGKKNGMTPLWVMLGIAGAAAAATLVVRKVKHVSDEDIQDLVASAERAAKALEERLLEYRPTG